MLDKSSKVILVCILICLVIIILKPNNIQVSLDTPNVKKEISKGDEILTLSPNRIAVVHSMNGTILVFDYDSNTKTFNYAGSMNYLDYFRNPSKYGVPIN